MNYREIEQPLRPLALTVLAVWMFASMMSAQAPTNEETPFTRAIDHIGKPVKPIAFSGLARGGPSIRNLLLSGQPLPRRELRGWHVDRPERPGSPTADPDRNNVLTIPHWSDSFMYHGLTYKYTMVGTDPKRGSATTIIPTVIIPLRFVFDNGLVVDAGADSIDGHTSVEGVINSPIFQPHGFEVGGISIGNTQYGDAFQRANFWDLVSRQSPDYHVLLGQPTVAPAFEVHVRDDEVIFYTDPDTGLPVPAIDGFLLEVATYDAIAQANLSPQALPIVLWGNVFGIGFGGFHSAYSVSGGAQTAISVGYHPRSPSYFGLEDTNELSHEILEWLNDPFFNNFTPGWNFAGLSTYAHCYSSSIVSDHLEVADVVEPFIESDLPISLGAVTYHVTDAVFLDYFTRMSPSRSANGQYSFFGVADSPSPACAGHVELEMTPLEFPNATSTAAFGINDNGWIVGDFRDTSGRLHGYIYDGRTFARLDYPGAVATIARGLNDAGEVVGYYFDPDLLPHGFLYNRGRFIPISFPGSIDNTSVADGINSRGDIVGSYDETVEITHGFVYHNGQYRTLDTPFAQQAEVNAVNNFGAIAGDTWDDPFNGPALGFLLDKNGFRQFNFPGSSDTFIDALNNSGMHGGNFFDIFGGDGYVTIYGYPYEVYGDVFGMNDQGQIVGATFDFNSGRQVGYVATLPK